MCGEAVRLRGWHFADAYIYAQVGKVIGAGCGVSGGVGLLQSCSFLGMNPVPALARRIISYEKVPFTYFVFSPLPILFPPPFPDDR